MALCSGVGPWPIHLSAIWFLWAPVSQPNAALTRAAQAADGELPFSTRGAAEKPPCALRSARRSCATSATDTPAPFVRGRLAGVLVIASRCAKRCHHRIFASGSFCPKESPFLLESAPFFQALRPQRRPPTLLLSTSLGPALAWTIGVPSGIHLALLTWRTTCTSKPP